MNMSYQPSICIITPTIGRATLRNTLESAQIGPGDHWIVLADGPNEQAREIWFNSPMARLNGVFFAESLIRRGDYGNPLRDEAMNWATQDYFIFLDDDDVFAPGAVDIIKREIKEHYHRPIMFRMINGNGEILWKTREITPGNVGGSMLCCPNIKDKLGIWANGAGHRSDFEFIEGTLKNFGPGWRHHLFWSGEVIIHVRPQ
jgi:glycosyltransferase involved in cell wall biosynthesis